MNEQSQPSVLSALWRYRLMAVVIVADVTLLSAAAGLLISPPPTATAVLALNNPQPGSVIAPDIVGDASLARYVAQRARFVSSDAVMDAAAELLEREDIPALRRQVTVTPSGVTNTMDITVEADTPQQAAEIANVVVEAYGEETEAQVRQLTDAAIETIDESALQAAAIVDPDASGAMASSVASTLNQLRLEAWELERNRALFGNGIEFVTAPSAATAAVAGPPLRETALGFLLGLVLAATVAWLRADRERGISSALAAEPLLDAPLLGQVRTLAGEGGGPGPFELAALPSHDFRLVWSGLLRRASTGVLLVNAVSDEPRSVAALNLAVAGAREQLSVLLVDADIEHAALSMAMGLPSEGGGLRELLTEGSDYRKRVLSVDVGGRIELSVVPSGRGLGVEPNVSTQLIEDTVAEWRKDFDLVIVDSPPLGSSQLASVLSGAADGALVVVRKGAEVSQLEELRRWVNLQGTPVVGYVYLPSEKWSWRPADRAFQR